MRLVVDTNQATPIQRTYKDIPREQRPCLVIPPLVWAELVLGRGNEARRRALLKFDLKFGMDGRSIFEVLSQSNEEQIRNFVPIRDDDRVTHGRVRFNFEHPAREHIRIASQQREDAVSLRDTFGPYLQRIRRENLDAMALANQRGIPGPEFVRWANISEAEPTLFTNEDAPYQRWFIHEIVTDADGAPREHRCQSLESLWAAVWENLLLRRFIRISAIVNFGYAQGVWGDPGLNLPFAAGRNDETDFSLLLYAQDGDAILTEDRIGYALKHADVENRITVQSWYNYRRRR